VAGFYKKKNCLRTLRFCLALAAGPTPSPFDQKSLTPSGSYARMDIVDNVDNGLQVASLHNMWTMWTIIFLLSTLSTLSLFLFAWEFPARGFVDNVDIVDARSELVADESVILHHCLYIQYILFS
jgi:hypothetical protein